MKLALERMLVPAHIGKGAKGSQKGRRKGSKGSPKEVLAAFKEKFGQPGISFDEKRAKDTAALLAAVKAIVEGLDE